MSWIQQEKRRAQGSWVSVMPRPMVAGYARARAASCPLVGLVGACCSGCAEGKGCAAEEEIKHHVGDTAGFESAIPWADVEATNAKVDHVQEAAAALVSAPQGSPEAQRYALWNLFYGTWHIWFMATKAGLDESIGVPGARFIHGDNAETYKSLALGFNEQLKALEALQVKASADPVDTRSPAGKFFDETVKGVLGGAGGALGGAATILTYVAVGGAVLLGGYLLWPVFAARVLR